MYFYWELRVNGGETEQKKPPTKWIVVGVAVVGVIIVAFIAYSVLMPIVNRPNPDITMIDSREGFQGLNYVVYVDVRVTNQGGEGWIKVYAEIRGGGRYEELNQRIYIDEGETKDLQFVFDVGFLQSLFSSMTYRAWAVVE